MTLLSIVQRTADEAGVPRPTAVASGTDPGSRQFFALANTVLQELCRMDWPVLIKDATLPLVPATTAYNTPADFVRLVANTAYNSSNYYAVRNQVSPAEWQRQKYSMLSGIGQYKMRLAGYPKQIHFTPTPQVADSIVYEYITNERVVQDGGGSYSSLYTLDTDTSIVPEELVQLGIKWRIKMEKGLAYAEDFNYYEATRQQLFAQSISLEDLPVAVRYGVNDAQGITDGYVPESGFG